jgi:hypothetical protein
METPVAFAVSESLRSRKAALRRAKPRPSPVNWERLAALALNFVVWALVIAGARAFFVHHG